MTHSLAYRVFRKDLGRKAVALLLALLAWGYMNWRLSDDPTFPLDVFTVTSRVAAEQGLASVPGLYVVVPEHLIVRHVHQKIINVRLKGLRTELENLRLAAVVEVPTDALGTADEAKLKIPLERTMLRAEGGMPRVSDWKISPNQLELTLAESTRESFDLTWRNVQFEGTQRSGYAVLTQEAQVLPNQVVLSGPRSAIAELRENPTRLLLAPIDVDGKSVDVSRQVGLDHTRVDPGVTLETVDRKVTVVMPVRPMDVSRELFLVPVVYNAPEDLVRRNLRVVEKTEVLDLIVSGPPSVLDPLTPDQLKRAIQPTFDWRDAGLEQAKDRVRFLSVLPDSVSILGIDGRDPEIEYKLAPIDPRPEPGADAGPKPGNDTP